MSFPCNRVRAGIDGGVRSFDAFRNVAARMGYGTPSLPEGTEYVLTRLTYNYWLMITLYECQWLCRRIIDAPVHDMIRAWPRIISDLTPDQLKGFSRTLARCAVPATVGLIMKWARLFGGAGGLMVIDGHENILDEPLDLDAVSPGSFQGVIPFDRWSGIVPDAEVSTDFDYPGNYNLPKFYSIRADGVEKSKVHHSRILRFTGPTVPQPEFQAYSRWGISYLALVYEEVRKRDNMSTAILNLMFRASILGQKNNQLAGLLSGLNGPGDAAVKYYEIMQQQNQLLSNQSMLILPEDGGLESAQYTFGGVADVYQQFQLDLSGAAEMPVTVLWGRTLTGLGQSNDADLRLYEQKIAQKCSDEMNPVLQEQLYPVMLMSEFGEIPDDFELKNPPIRVLTDEEKAKLGTDITNSVSTLYQSGIYSQKMALQDIQETSGITGIGTNITPEDIENANDEFVMDELSGDTEEPAHAKAADSVPLTAHGFPIEIEARMGEERYGGKLPAHYGNIVGTRSAEGDKEAMDCFLNPADSEKIFVIDGYLPDGTFDEHKCMFGYADGKDALQDFTEYYKSIDGRTGKVHFVSARDLRRWLREGDMTRPFAQRKLLALFAAKIAAKIA